MASDEIGRELFVDEHRWCVRVGGEPQPSTLLGYHFRPGVRRPYVGALAGYSGRNLVEVAPPDQPSHLGVWWSHGDVEGVDFCSEMAVDDVYKGRIEHVAFDELVDDDPWFGFDESLEWRGPDGEVLLTERRVVLAHFGHEEWWSVDLDSTFTAVRSLRLGADAEIMLPGVRVAEPLSPAGGGRLTTSTGATTRDAVADEAASWLDCSGTRNDLSSRPVTEGLTIMAHPEGEGSPPRWEVGTNGDIAPRPGSGNVGVTDLDAGTSFRRRHRLLAHAGSAPEADVAGHYERWVSEAGLE